jgi:serine/threonine protein phosphatase PrpC
VNEPTISFESYAATHTGRVRSLNEDCFLAEPRSGVWLVADGMGGHDAGELASASIVAHLATLGVASSAPDLRARFEDRILRANTEIWDIAQSRGGTTIGSTVAALLTYERQYACIWSGDSRVYLVRNGILAQVSHDHTEVQELLDRGILNAAEARDWPRRNVITRAIGVTEEVMTDIELGQVEPGDVFVLNTDGLTAHVSEEEIRLAVIDRSPEDACTLLIDTVLDRGATDNVTVVIVKCHAANTATDGSTVVHPGRDMSHVR